jgi:hypothetical protein
MNINPLSGASNSLIQPARPSAPVNAGPGNTNYVVGGTVSMSTGDIPVLSPPSRISGALQTLQQTDPTTLQNVTQQIAANLQTAAQTASASGNTAAATQLTHAATTFSDASQSGQAPTAQAVAQAATPAHHHGHGHHMHAGPVMAGAIPFGSGDSSSTGSTTSSTSTSSINTPTNSSDLIAQFTSGAAAAQSSALDPIRIIVNTMNSAGLKLQS